MAVNETIITGRKFRRLIDETSKLWQTISFWTKASDVEFDDGKTAETKLGAIDGITSSLMNSDSIAASIKCVNQINTNVNNSINEINNNLNQQPTFIYDSTGKITGYTTEAGGADTVFPFINLPDLSVRFGMYGDDSPSNYIFARLVMTVPEGYTNLRLYFKSSGEDSVGGSDPWELWITGCGLNIDQTSFSGTNQTFHLNYSGTSSIEIKIMYRYVYAVPCAVFSRN